MSKKRGFTLIELMVVILIVSILAAVAVPIMRGRIDSAKWSEGKAMAGTLATSLRAYYAEKGSAGTSPNLATLGFSTSDFKGTYFSDANYGWTSSWDTVTLSPIFKITVSSPADISTPPGVTLDHLGEWIDLTATPTISRP
jgi:prepilin-type N-terminal cleavage/methylation domain-containing protein